MKKRVYLVLGLSFILLSLLSNVSYAAPAIPDLIERKQPSGEVFKGYLRGDEYFNYSTLEDGEVITIGEDGYWYYAQLEGKARSSQRSITETGAKVAIDEKPEQVLTEENLLKNGVTVETQKETLDEPAVSKARSQKRDENLLVILVEFDDAKIKYSDEEWNQRIFAKDRPSLVHYYNDQTQGKINIVPAKETYGSSRNGIVKVKIAGNHTNPGGDQETINAKNQEIAKAATLAAAQYVDFSEYDFDNNGRISADELHIMMIVAGNEASAGSKTQSVWAHHWGIYDNAHKVNGKILSPYTQFGELQHEYQATMGIIVHEFGHDLGLPDLYNVGERDENKNLIKEGIGLGYTSVMASGSWGHKKGELTGETPVGLDAYSRSLLGLPVETINQPGTKTAIAKGNNLATVYKLLSDNPKEYFLIENRQLTGYDAGMQYGYYDAIVSGGMAVYRINTNFTRNITLGKQLVKIMEADEGVLGYSQYDNGQRLLSDPFYYLGQGRHGAEQTKELSSLTRPALKTSDNLPGKFNLTIDDASKQEMRVTFSERTTGTFGTVPWEWDEKNQTVIFAGGAFPSSNSKYNIQTEIEASEQLKGKAIKKIIFTEKVTANSNSSFLFAALSELTEIEHLEKLDTSNVVTVSAMFYRVSSLQTLDINNWSTNKITNMSYMFNEAFSLSNLDLSKWDTSKVINMSYIFSYASSLTSLDISGWDTRNVSLNNQQRMFSLANKLSSLVLGKNTFIKETNLPERVNAPYTGKWTNGSQSYDSSADFMVNYDGSSPGKYERQIQIFGTAPWEWNDGSQTVTFKGGKFPNTNSQYNIQTEIESSEKLKGKKIKKIVFTESVEANSNSSHLFATLSELTEIEGAEKLDTSSVISMTAMFYQVRYIRELKIEDWDTSKTTNMSYMFNEAFSITNLDLSKWNTSNVRDMSYTFSYTSSLARLDISGWDTRNILVTKQHRMFSLANKLDIIILGRDTVIKDTNLPERVNSIYTGKWTNGSQSYNSSAEFMANYDGSTPGKYEREKK